MTTEQCLSAMELGLPVAVNIGAATTFGHIVAIANDRVTVSTGGAVTFTNTLKN